MGSWPSQETLRGGLAVSDILLSRVTDRRRHQALGLAPRRSKAFPRQRPLDVAVLHGQVPLDREVLRRDQLDHFGDFGAQRSGKARHDPRVIFGIGKKQGYGAVGERQTYLKPKRRGQHTFFFQLAEDEIRIDRVLRVAETPPSIAETDLSHSRLHAEPELVVNALRPPALDTVFVGSGPP